MVRTWADRKVLDGAAFPELDGSVSLYTGSQRRRRTGAPARGCRAPVEAGPHNRAALVEARARGAGEPCHSECGDGFHSPLGDWTVGCPESSSRPRPSESGGGDRQTEGPQKPDLEFPSNDSLEIGIVTRIPRAPGHNFRGNASQSLPPLLVRLGGPLRGGRRRPRRSPHLVARHGDRRLLCLGGYDMTRASREEAYSHVQGQATRGGNMVPAVAGAEAGKLPGRGPTSGAL